MNYLKTTFLCVFITLTLSSSTCINRDTINNVISPSSFVILDSYLSIEIDLAADRCFDEVDINIDDSIGEDSYEKWHYCMRNYYKIESLLEEVKNNLNDGDMDNLKRNAGLLADLMVLLGLDIPEDIMNFLDGNTLQL